MKRVTLPQARCLQAEVQQFIRSFGLLRDGQTPCGQPLPPSQAQALHVLLAAGPAAQQRLAAALYLDKSSVSRLLDRMERRGWITRAPNRENRREKLVSLTPSGTAAAQRLRQSARARFEALVACLSGDEVDAVLSALAVLNQAVGALPDRAVGSTSEEEGLSDAP